MAFCIDHEGIEVVFLESSLRFQIAALRRIGIAFPDDVCSADSANRKNRYKSDHHRIHRGVPSMSLRQVPRYTTSIGNSWVGR
jgi:hypothetical protein